MTVTRYLHVKNKHNVHGSIIHTPSVHGRMNGLTKHGLSIKWGPSGLVKDAVTDTTAWRNPEDTPLSCLIQVQNCILKMLKMANFTSCTLCPPWGRSERELAERAGRPAGGARGPHHSGSGTPGSISPAGGAGQASHRLPPGRVQSPEQLETARAPCGPPERVIEVSFIPFLRASLTNFQDITGTLGLAEGASGHQQLCLHRILRQELTNGVYTAQPYPSEAAKKTPVLLFIYSFENSQPLLESMKAWFLRSTERVIS